MIEYYCTNCGADLEDQPGFEPESDCWYCTECGVLLINPEDEDTDAQFEDVGWFCDDCGAYLNKQSGFSDWLDTWICTECGYENIISEEEIYESEEAYQRSKSESKDSERDDIWEDESENESEDDAYYEEDEQEEDTYYEEDEDNGDDSGCYYENDKSESKSRSGERRYSNLSSDQRREEELRREALRQREEELRIREELHQREKELHQREKELHRQEELHRKEEDIHRQEELRRREDELRKQEELRLREREYKRREEKDKKEEIHRVKSEEKRKKRVKFQRIITGEKQKAGISSDECKKMNYTEIVSMLKRQEFYNIKTRIIDDLEVEDILREGTVEFVSFDGIDVFAADTQFPYSANIEVVYHLLRRQNPPLTSKEADGMDVEDVVWEFTNAGFINIDKIAMPDLVKGWIVKEDSVEVVEIDGKDNFRKSDRIKINAHIIIRYHTFSNKGLN